MSEINKDLIKELLKDYKKPEDLIGKDGILKQLTKALLETALDSELTEHLGYEKNALSKKKKKQEQQAKEIEVLRKEVMDDASGGSITPGNGIESDSDPYYALIHDRIWGQWVWHDPDARELTAVISMKIGKDGEIVSREIDKSSGNALFDRSAMNAIIKASPLPPPPVEMEVVLRFRP